MGDKASESLFCKTEINFQEIRALLKGGPSTGSGPQDKVGLQMEDS